MAKRSVVSHKQPTLFADYVEIPSLHHEKETKEHYGNASVKPSARPSLSSVKANFHRSMIGYEEYIKCLQPYPEIYNRFIANIVNVTGRIPFPIQEDDAKRGDEYLQRKLNKILDELYPAT